MKITGPQQQLYLVSRYLLILRRVNIVVIECGNSICVMTHSSSSSLVEKIELIYFTILLLALEMIAFEQNYYSQVCLGSQQTNKLLTHARWDVCLLYCSYEVSHLKDLFLILMTLIIFIFNDTFIMVWKSEEVQKHFFLWILPSRPS